MTERDTKGSEWSKTEKGLNIYSAFPFHKFTQLLNLLLQWKHLLCVYWCRRCSLRTVWTSLNESHWLRKQWTKNWWSSKIIKQYIVNLKCLLNKVCLRTNKQGGKMRWKFLKKIQIKVLASLSNNLWLLTCKIIDITFDQKIEMNFDIQVTQGYNVMYFLF